ncbi:MAG: methyltransferase domain-containing protein [Nitrospirae bacterium]|nr:methyltransferase domain-containing protein [Nitrospirota bacterium]
MKWDAEQYDLTHAPQIDAGMELIDRAKVREDDCVLDLGCGTGKLTVELARLAARGNVIGIDPSDEMLSKAREVSADLGNMHLLKIPAQSMDFEKEFDLVFSNSALQWIKEQEDVVARAHRALKPYGRLAVQMPAKDFCWTLSENIQSAIAALGLDEKFNRMESPWRFPLKEELYGFLKDAGFGNINVSYKDYVLLFDSINDVLKWGVSAALRPYLAPLSEKKQERFKYAFAMGFENYRTKRGIEFNFRRLFAFADK